LFELEERFDVALRERAVVLVGILSREGCEFFFDEPALLIDLIQDIFWIRAGRLAVVFGWRNVNVNIGIIINGSCGSRIMGCHACAAARGSRRFMV
jgi:hypothetical protein